VTHAQSDDLDGRAALTKEQQAEDTPPRRPEALWPQVAPRSDPADVPGTDPDRVDQQR
jgi:hypothetical protein